MIFFRTEGQSAENPSGTLDVIYLFFDKWTCGRRRVQGSVKRENKSGGVAGKAKQLLLVDV